MENPSENTFEFNSMPSDPTSELTEDAELQPLTPSRQVELWTGRVAMVGFMTTVAAIAAT